MGRVTDSVNIMNPKCQDLSKNQDDPVPRFTDSEATACVLFLSHALTLMLSLMMRGASPSPLVESPEP